jgi:hypothetical protein
MSGFFPVDRDLFTSSVWLAGSLEEKVLWVWLLGNRDDSGVVRHRELAIAYGSGLPRAAVEAALVKFSGPDEDSRTKDNDGRRIDRTADGFVRIMNHELYYSRDYSTPRWRRWRERNKKTKELSTTQTVGKRQQTPPTVPPTKDTDKDTDTDKRTDNGGRPETAIKALEDAGKALAEMTDKKIHDHERAGLVAEVNGLLREIAFLGGGDGQQELRAASKFPGKAGLVRTDTAPLPWLRVARDRLLERKMGLQEQQAQGVQAQAPYPWEPEGIAAQDKAKAEIMARVKR